MQRRYLTPKELILLLLLNVAFSAFARPAYFAPPESPYILHKEEHIQSITISKGTVSDLQAKIDDCRLAHPDDVIVVCLEVPLVVKKAPLRLPSRMCLILDDGVQITAHRSAKAEVLILIESAEFVSVSGVGLDRAVLDGQSKCPSAIMVRNSGRINFDYLDIRNCVNTAVDYIGRGSDRISDAGSVTRCRISHCGANGLHARDSAQFVCLDNDIFNNRGTGIDVDSLDAAIVNNYCWNNTIGITAGGARGAVAENVLRDNGTGILLSESSGHKLVTYNRLEGNATGVVVEGNANPIYYNDLENERELVIRGEKNVVAGHLNLLPEEGTAPDNVYFNPPTVANNHKDEIIVNGKGRFDVTIQSGEEGPMPLADVQRRINEARVEHPDDVLVLHLQGNFEALGEGTGLQLPADTCVVLHGTVRSNSEGMAGKDTQLIMMDKGGVASWSGGIIDGNFQPYHAINIPGGNIAVIDRVIVKRAGFNGIATKHHHGGHRPVLIRGCTVVNSQNRGIWIHVCSNVHAIRNVSSGNRSDGIDFDAYGNASTALFNVCTGNQRDGFFVEEAVKNCLMFGNVLDQNRCCGIGVWNNQVKGNTGRNVIICNTCEGNGNGITVGGRHSEYSGNDNFFFNNICIRNVHRGFNYRNSSAKNNYCSQAILFDNPENLSNNMGRPLRDYFAVPVHRKY